LQQIDVFIRFDWLASTSIYHVEGVVPVPITMEHHVRNSSGKEMEKTAHHADITDWLFPALYISGISFFLGVRFHKNKRSGSTVMDGYCRNIILGGNWHGIHYFCDKRFVVVNMALFSSREEISQLTKSRTVTRFEKWLVSVLGPQR
jgi:hypothetical protein